MRAITYILTLILSVATSGCAKPPPEVVIVSADPLPLNLPDECVSRDPRWTHLPDAAIMKKDLPRNSSINQAQYSEILGRRSICRAAINAQTKKG